MVVSIPPFVKCSPEPEGKYRDNLSWPWRLIRLLAVLQATPLTTLKIRYFGIINISEWDYLFIGAIYWNIESHQVLNPLQIPALSLVWIGANPAVNIEPVFSLEYLIWKCKAIAHYPFAYPFPLRPFSRSIGGVLIQGRLADRYL